MDLDVITRRYVKTKSDEKAYDMGMRLYPGRANKVRNFFKNHLYHHTGKWAGRNFELIDWQWNDVVLPAYGWIKPDGNRRFNKVYILIPKKNGKSTLSSGLSLYGTCADNEASANVFIVACDKMQASIVYEEAVKMLQASPELSSIMYSIPSKKLIEYAHTSSKMQVHSSDANTKQGYNISMIVGDEVHAWARNSKIWGALKYAGRSRSQPLFFLITTAGDEKEGLWWDERSYSHRVLNGDVIDTSYLPVIYEADEDDDVHDPKVWKKANPSLGITMELDAFTHDYETAKNSPTEWADFLRYSLNLPITSYNRWVDIDVWDHTNQVISKDKLRGQKCYVGFDLSAKIDLSGFVFYFPKFHALLPFAFCSRGSLLQRKREKKEDLTSFERKGELIVHDGPAVDRLDVLKRFFIEAEKYKVSMVAFDRWNATTDMDIIDSKGFKVFECSQQYSGMSEPMKLLEVEILSEKIQHFNNSILRWCFKNVVSVGDGNGNVKPMKNKSPEKIDLAVASIMAKACHVHQSLEAKKSVYEKGNIFGESSNKGTN